MGQLRSLKTTISSWLQAQENINALFKFGRFLSQSQDLRFSFLKKQRLDCKAQFCRNYETDYAEYAAMLTKLVPRVYTL